MNVNYVEARRSMVEEQLERRGINDLRVLRAMAEVPRHLFLEKDLWEQAYEDHPLPIGANQTISQPYIVALMAQALELKGTERVLEVGTGSGYAAAVLSQLAADVFSIETVEELAIKARALLSHLGYNNVSVLSGDGTLGWRERAPYDAIVVSAGAPCIPRPLIEQLTTPGRLVLPMGERDLQSLVRVRKDGAGIHEEYLGECHFVRLKGEYGWSD